MASTFNLSQHVSHVEIQENNKVSSRPPSISSNDHCEPSNNSSEEKTEEQELFSESEETDMIAKDTNDYTVNADSTTTNTTNMVAAVASFSEETSADLTTGAKRSSVARILVKPGQIFRVQVDNEVKEVHGPATVRMISENGPAFPLPLHLPPGHIVQQILDENGVLTHVIMPQPGPPPPPPPPSHPHLRTGYSASLYNGLYGHPHQYPNPNVYATYSPDTLAYSPGSICNHTSSSGTPTHCLPHISESNCSPTTTTIGGNPSLLTTSTNNQQSHSPVYNTNNNACTTTRGGSNGRNLNNVRQKRRIPTSPSNNDSYVNNATMNGSHKSPHHLSSSASHYPAFYPDTIVQPTNELADLAVARELDKKRQTIEKSLSQLEPPIIQDIESRSALVKLQPPCSTSSQSDYSIDFTNLIYELLLSDKGKEAKYKQVYCGDANEITLKDLEPATEYHLK